MAMSSQDVPVEESTPHLHCETATFSNTVFDKPPVYKVSTAFEKLPTFESKLVFEDTLVESPVTLVSTV